MNNFIPREKLSKKAKQKLNALQRKGWNGINPVTRRTENPKAYNRKKLRRNDWDSGEVFVFTKDIGIIFLTDAALPEPNAQRSSSASSGHAADGTGL